jgi:hypothetical protein
MESIKNFSDFKTYVDGKDLKSEDEVFDLLGFVIAKDDKKMFDYLVNKRLDYNMKQMVKELLEESDEKMYNKWSDNITLAKTGIDLTGDSAGIDNDPIERELGGDDEGALSKMVDEILDSNSKPKSSKKHAETYSFAVNPYGSYDGYESSSSSSSGDLSSEDEFVKQLEKSLNV